MQLKKVSTGPALVLQRNNSRGFKISPSAHKFKFFLKHTNTIVDKSQFIPRFMLHEAKLHYFLFPEGWMKTTTMQMLAFAIGVDVDEEGNAKEPEATKAYQVFVRGRIPPLSGGLSRAPASHVDQLTNSSLDPIKDSDEAQSEETSTTYYNGRYASAPLETEKEKLGDILYPNYEKLNHRFTIASDRTAIKLIASHPVIYLSDFLVYSKNFSAFLDCLHSALASIYDTHKYLLKSRKLQKQDKQSFNKYQDLFKFRDLKPKQIKEGLRNLSFLLHKHFDKEVVIIIDEWNHSLNEGRNYVSKADTYAIKQFMEDMLELTFLDNKWLKKGAIVSQTAIDQMSNCRLRNAATFHSLHQGSFADIFGLTAEEVMALCPLKKVLRSNWLKFTEWYSYDISPDKCLFFPHHVVEFFHRLAERKQNISFDDFGRLMSNYHSRFCFITNLFRNVKYSLLRKKLNDISSKGYTLYEKPLHHQRIDYETTKELISRIGIEESSESSDENENRESSDEENKNQKKGKNRVRRQNSQKRENSESSISNKDISSDVAIHAFFNILLSEGWLKMTEHEGKGVLTVMNKHMHDLLQGEIEYLKYSALALKRKCEKEVAESILNLIYLPNGQDPADRISAFKDSFKRLLDSMVPFVRKPLRSIRTPYIFGNFALVRKLLVKIASSFPRDYFFGVDVPLVKDRIHPNVVFRSKHLGLLLIFEIQYQYRAAQAFFDPIAERRCLRKAYMRSRGHTRPLYVGIDLCVTHKKEVIIHHGFLLPPKEE